MKFKVALVLALFVASATVAAQAQQDIQVFVPGTASGYFGNPQDQAVPFVPAITVSGPGTITVTYISGQVDWGAGNLVGPDGGFWNTNHGMQDPLQETNGVAGGSVHNHAALIGAFVLQSRVQDRRGFTAIDGTKDATRVGIKPNTLFFIGSGKTIPVTKAGTLYLDINDCIVSDNGGGFTVEVAGP